MDFIEKLFKQYPFMYEIDGNFYVFGNYACKICNESHVIKRYKNYCEYLKTGDKNEVIKAFRMVYISSESFNKDNNIDLHPTEKFNDLNFNTEQMQNLKTQAENFIKVFQDYDLKNHL